MPGETVNAAVADNYDDHTDHTDNILTPDQERQAFKAAFDSSLTSGKPFNLLVSQWWQQWCEYTGFVLDPNDLDGSGATNGNDSDDDDMLAAASTSGVRPQSFDNGPLFAVIRPYFHLHSHLQEHSDFVFINTEAYQLLCQWYPNSGPHIQRQVVVRGLHEELVIELHPFTLLFRYIDSDGRVVKPDSEDMRVRTFNRDASIKHIIESMKPDPVTFTGDATKLEGRVWIRKSQRAGSDSNGTDSDSVSDSNDSDDDAAIQWSLVHEKDYNSTLEFLDYASGTELALEYRHPQYPDRWCRSASLKAITNNEWRHFAVGDSIDAQDTQQKWYESLIVNVLPVGHVKVHFKGWAEKWDETIDANSPRLAPLSLYTTGAKETGKPLPSEKPVNKLNTLGRSVTRGAVGLRNLGNTCFMNSIIQCMIQTPSVTEFFLEKHYLKQINKENPLGFQGRVASEYGELCQEMWSGQFTCVAPRTFKQTLGEFQPRFSGYQQHDSSEFLSFLLDGLHEDLNLVMKKPLTTQVESNGRPDDIVAKESWERHLQRNRSIIVDNFQGQFKSKVTCPQCRKESITFDPYLFLSLPLPQQTHVVKTVTFIPSLKTSRALSYPHRPILLALQLQKGATGDDLKHSLINTLKVASIEPRTLLCTVLYNNKINHVIKQEEPVESRTGRQAQDIWIYEVEELIENLPQSTVEKFLAQQVTIHVGESGRKSELSPPLAASVVAIPAALMNIMTPSRLHHCLMKAISPFIVRKDGSDDTINHSEAQAMATTDGEPPDAINGIDSDEELETASVRSDVAMNGTDAHNSSSTDKLPSYTRPSYTALVQTDRSCSIAVFAFPPSSFESESPDVFDLHSLQKGRGISWACIYSPSSPYVVIEPAQYIQHPSLAANRYQPQSLKRGLDIQDCVSAFTREEVLRKSEAWYCSNCKQHQQASKKIDLWSLPNILILHLKRFSFTSIHRDKLDVRVDFPIEGLVMTGERTSDRYVVYDLYAVSQHYGGLGGGHYTAVAKNLKNMQWYSLDDSSVQPVSQQAIVTEAAYVLFYRKRSLGDSHSVALSNTVSAAQKSGRRHNFA